MAWTCAASGQLQVSSVDAAPAGIDELLRFCGFGTDDWNFAEAARYFAATDPTVTPSAAAYCAPLVALVDGKPVVTRSAIDLAESAIPAQLTEARELLNTYREMLVNTTKIDAVDYLKHDETDVRDISVRIGAPSIEDMGFSKFNGLDCFRYAVWCSTEEVDSYGDTILASAWENDLPGYQKNPMLLWMHDMRLPIGCVPQIEVVANKGLYARECVIIQNSVNSVYIDMVRAGILKGHSVGFKTVKYEVMDADDPWGPWRITQARLKENSLVTLPANAPCLIGENPLKADFDEVRSYMLNLRSIAMGGGLHTPTSVFVPGAVAKPVEGTLMAPLPSPSGEAVVGHTDDPAPAPVAETTPETKAADEGDASPALELRMAVEVPDGDLSADGVREYIQLNMGLLHTRRHDLSDAERAEALTWLGERYVDLGLTAPEVADGAAYKDIKFAHDERALVVRHIMHGTVESLTSGLKHVQSSSITLREEQLLELRECCLTIWATLTAAGVDLTVEAEAETPEDEAGEAEGTDENLSEQPGGETRTNVSDIMRALGIDPDAEDADAQLDAVCVALKDNEEARDVLNDLLSSLT